MATTSETLHTLTVDGSEIAYSDRGQGDSLLLLHAGVFSDWFTPLAADDSLADRRVVRVVRAGYTATPPATHPVGIADHAGHAAALLDHLGIAHAQVVGHSSSCAIALQLGLDRPDLVSGLVLLEPPLTDTFAAPEDLEMLHSHLGPVLGGAAGAAAAGDVATAFDTFMGAVCGADYRHMVLDALGPDGLARAEQESTFFFADEMMTVARWDFDDAAAHRITQPTLLLYGEDSPAMTHRLVQRLATELPYAETASLLGANHAAPLTHPAELGVLISHAARS